MELHKKSVWRVRGTLVRFEAEGSPQYEVLFEAYFPERDSAHAVYHKGEREYGIASGHGNMRWELEGFYFGNDPHIEQMFEDVRNELEEVIMNEYVCVVCGKKVQEEDAVWVNDDPHHVECAPEEDDTLDKQ